MIKAVLNHFYAFLRSKGTVEYFLTKQLNILYFKGDLLGKYHFYKVFEHSCVAALCENNQPIMLKIHQLFYFIKPRAVSPNELFQILPLSMS